MPRRLQIQAAPGKTYWWTVPIDGNERDPDPFQVKLLQPSNAELRALRYELMRLGAASGVVGEDEPKQQGLELVKLVEDSEAYQLSVCQRYVLDTRNYFTSSESSEEVGGSERFVELAEPEVVKIVVEHLTASLRRKENADEKKDSSPLSGSSSPAIDVPARAEADAESGD